MDKPSRPDQPTAVRLEVVNLCHAPSPELMKRWKEAADAYTHAQAYLNRQRQNVQQAERDLAECTEAVIKARKAFADDAHMVDPLTE